MKLSGVKVLDLSAFLPGPHMTMMMADHGAEVIMVEPDNGLGEPTRAMGEKYTDGTSVWFANIARGKKSYKVNLKDTDQHMQFMKLAVEADVFVEAFRPGVVKRLGVDYDAIKAVNPSIIYCSISAFGQDNDLAMKPAHDLTIQAMAGLVDVNRSPDGTPANPNMPGADTTASLMALSAILMALYRRTQTRKGDFIDIAMFDSLLAWTPNVTGPVFAENADPEPQNMRSFGGNAMYRIYTTKDDQHIVLGGSEVKFAINLLTALGREDLISIARWEPGAQEELIAFFNETFASKTKDEWISFLSNIDCCWSDVRSLKDAFSDPHTIERGMVLTDETGYRHIGVPMRFMDEPAKPNFDVPEFGQHSNNLKKGF